MLYLEGRIKAPRFADRQQEIELAGELANVKAKNESNIGRIGGTEYTQAAFRLGNPDPFRALVADITKEPVDERFAESHTAAGNA
jgi:hypothetical protein